MTKIDALPKIPRPPGDGAYSAINTKKEMMEADRSRESLNLVIERLNQVIDAVQALQKASAKRVDPKIPTTDR